MPSISFATQKEQIILQKALIGNVNDLIKFKIQEIMDIINDYEHFQGTYKESYSFNLATRLNTLSGFLANQIKAIKELKALLPNNPIHKRRNIMTHTQTPVLNREIYKNDDPAQMMGIFFHELAEEALDENAAAKRIRGHILTNHPSFYKDFLHNAVIHVDGDKVFVIAGVLFSELKKEVRKIFHETLEAFLESIGFSLEVGILPRHVNH